MTLIALPVGQIIALSTAGVASALVLRRAAPLVRFSWRNVSLREGRELYSWSWLFWLNSLAVVLIYQTDNLVVAAGAGLTATAVFSLTSRLPLYAMPIILALPDSCLPAAVELCEHGKIDRVRDVYRGVMRATAGAAVAVGVVAVAFNAPFMRLWVGVDNYGGALLTFIFAVILFYRVMMQTASFVIIGVGKIRGVVFMSVIEAVLNLTLSLWWVQKFGMIGVAAATAVAGFATSGWYVTRVVSREVQIPLAEQLWRGILVPVFCAIPAGGMAIVINRVAAPAGWLDLAIACSLVGLTYAATFVVIGIDAAERRLLYARFRHLLPERWRPRMVDMAPTQR
jgi:O-antigen/teichoic acid export membrane protein